MIESEGKALDIFSEVLHDMQSRLQGHFRVSGILRKQGMPILCAFVVNPKVSCLFGLFLNATAQLPAQVTDLCELRSKET